ncbi:MAG TPA: PPK2 family polyphosphate kinase [Mycobacteriales bacterium]|jgi:PPK2 family polyphosphate:nucleotide phosphotransferase
MSVRDLLLVPPGGKVDLTAVDPRSTPGLPDRHAVGQEPKAWARADVAACRPHLADLQRRLYASSRVAGDPRRVLLVLQAMDCGGKDGVIRHVIGGLDPNAVQVTHFRAPDREERRHHFLWRVRRALPPAGYVGVFNRSHYEDVLVVRVHELVPREIWRRRYDEINRFEAGLAVDGYVVVKAMLHISPEEQAARLLARLDDPAKRWKYDRADVEERARWDDYREAYEAALARCSTTVAPWYVVPADRKWYRDWAVSRLLTEVMDGLALRYPEPPLDVGTERARIAATQPR